MISDSSKLDINMIDNEELTKRKTLRDQNDQGLSKRNLPCLLTLPLFF